MNIDVATILNNPNHPAWKTITVVFERMIKALITDKDHPAWPSILAAHQDLNPDDFASQTLTENVGRRQDGGEGAADFTNC